MKTVNRTFRLDEELLLSVRQLAHHRNASLNHVIADSLRKAVADSMMERLEMEHVPRAFMLKILEYLPDQNVSELGRWMVSVFAHDFVWEVFKEINLDTLIKSYEVLSTKYERLFTFEHQKEGLEHTIRLLNQGDRSGRSSTVKA